MATRIVVSYDGTENDTDALALARVLARAGASLLLAYVRHHREEDPAREHEAAREANRLLAAGADWLGDPDVPQHVVVSASTPLGLRDLAEREGADLIVFGSEYRTAPGRIVPGTSAAWLLEGGPVAVGLAPAGLRERRGVAVDTVAVVADDADLGPRETAEALASQLGATVVPRADTRAGLVVLGSKPGTPAGRVALSAAAQYLIELLTCPVLALPHGMALRFS
ncbi:MAG TPA: universal stress protein [Gaiellaceae bacterium]|nr:universal stress protein [Gaiellaceae bacterium]